MSRMDIDFVVTWVDMNDPIWKKQFAEATGKIDNSQNQFSEARFRDYGLLKYWFRGVEKFAPWARYIHFVTCGQKPQWLNTDNPKLKLVDHKDYIPNQFLPVFNSSLIELYFNRIPDLAEHFVYFNDDCYIISETPEERFFKNGLPQDIAAFRLNTGGSLWAKCMQNNMRLINSKFDKKKALAENHDKWFTPEYGSKSRMTRLMRCASKFPTLRVIHNAVPYLKSTYDEVWDCFGEELTRVSVHKFRSPEDYTQELFRSWRLCKGEFEPYNTYKDTKMYPLVMKPGAAIKAVREQAYKLVCLNDNAHIRNYEQVMSDLRDAFESILPEKSSFEI